MKESHAGFLQVGDRIDFHGREIEITEVSKGHKDSHGKTRRMMSGRDTEGRSVSIPFKTGDRVRMKDHGRSS